MCDPGQSASFAQCTSNRSERNSLSGKNYLPRHPAKGGRAPAHIGEALPPMAKGNPEGSPSDPVTTDPKGEAGRGAAERQKDAIRNTPALITTRAAYGERVPLDPWFVSGLAEREGWLLRLPCHQEQAANWYGGSSVVLALVEREGRRASEGSTDVRRMRMDPGVEDRSHLQIPKCARSATFWIRSFCISSAILPGGTKPGALRRLRTFAGWSSKAII
jgi:hypothetical protein